MGHLCIFIYVVEFSVLKVPPIYLNIFIICEPGFIYDTRVIQMDSQPCIQSSVGVVHVPNESRPQTL